MKTSQFTISGEIFRRFPGYVRGEALPLINALVDIGTTVSLRHVVSAGRHVIDVLAGNIALRLASEEESCVALGAEQVERPLAGEVVFCRRGYGSDERDRTINPPDLWHWQSWSRISMMWAWGTIQIMSASRM